MTKRLLSASGTAKLALTASLIAFAFLLGMLSEADNASMGGYRAALANLDQGLGKNVPLRSVALKTAHVPLQAASEDYWLGHAARTNTVPVAWTQGFEIGDVVTISTKQGERKLKVSRITAMPVNSQTRAGAKPAPLMFMVTAREAGHPDGLVMRLLVEDTQGALLHRSTTVSDRNL